MVIAQVVVSVLGEGTSVSRYVRIALKAMKESGVKVTPGPMSSVIEAETVEEILEAVKSAHLAVAATGAGRIITELKIDDRRDKRATAETKLRAVEGFDGS